MNPTVHLTRNCYIRMRKAIEGGLKDCLHQHGPITKHTFTSAAKRMAGMAWGALHNEAGYALPDEGDW